MKYTFIISLLFLSSISFAQTNYEELLKIYNMNSTDEFETYAIAKGYKFYKLIHEKDYMDSGLPANGVVYVKYLSGRPNFLAFFDDYMIWGKGVEYQTNNTSDILNLKTEIKKIGYNVGKTEFSVSSIKIENFSKIDDSIKRLFIAKLLTIPIKDENEPVRYIFSLFQMH